MNRFHIALSLICLLPLALGHMGLDPPEAPAGERTIVSLRIGHDCGDDTVGTTNFTVELPPRLPSVSVELMGNWRTIIHKSTMTAMSNPPMGTVDEMEEEYISSVTYLGFLPDGFYQEFRLRIKFPEEVGQVLWFKGYQDCHNQGTSISWATIPSESDPDPRYPARSVTLVAPEPEEESRR